MRCGVDNFVLFLVLVFVVRTLKIFLMWYDWVEWSIVRTDACRDFDAMRSMKMKVIVFEADSPLC